MLPSSFKWAKGEKSIPKTTWAIKSSTFWNQPSPPTTICFISTRNLFHNVKDNLNLRNLNLARSSTKWMFGNMVEVVHLFSMSTYIAGTLLRKIK